MRVNDSDFIYLFISLNVLIVFLNSPKDAKKTKEFYASERLFCMFNHRGLNFVNKGLFVQLPAVLSVSSWPLSCSLVFLGGHYYIKCFENIR